MADGLDFVPATLDRSSTFYVAGHRGLVGSAIWRKLESEGFTDLVGRTSSELDLKDREAVFAFFRRARSRAMWYLPPQKLVGSLQTVLIPSISSATIYASRSTFSMLRGNTAWKGFSSWGRPASIPKFAEQPIREDSLLTGHLEPTNDAYAIAKIAGIMQIQAVRRQYGLTLDLCYADQPLWSRRQFLPRRLARLACPHSAV